VLLNCVQSKRETELNVLWQICWMNRWPWDDSILVLAGKLRNLWDSLSELRSSLCERRLETAVLRPQLLSATIAHLTNFSVGYDVTRKIAQFNWVYRENCADCVSISMSKGHFTTVDADIYINIILLFSFIICFI